MSEYPSRGLTSRDIHPDVRADLKARGGTVYEFESVLDVMLGQNVACVQVRTEGGDIVVPWTPMEFVRRAHD